MEQPKCEFCEEPITVEEAEAYRGLCQYCAMDIYVDEPPELEQEISRRV